MAASPNVVRAEEHTVTDAERDYEHGSRLDRFVWWICGIFTRKPRQAFCGILGFILVVVVIVVAAGDAGNSEEQDHAWDMNSDIHVQQLDILDNLRDRTDVIAVDYSIREVALSGTSLIMMYETTNGKDILTAANLQRMCEAEKFFFSSDSYVDFCVAKTGTTCTATASGAEHSSCECEPPAVTVVGLFYGTSDLSWATSTTDPCPLLDEATVSATAASIYAALETSSGLQEYGFYVGADFSKKGYTSKARSLLQVGGPLEGFTVTLDDDDNQPSQEKKYQEYFEEVQDELIDLLDMKGSFMRSIFRDDTVVDGKVEVVWYSFLLSGTVFEDILEGDLTMVIFSILFVYMWMNAHTESCFISSVGMFQIVMSLPFSRLFYSIIGDIFYFSTLQSLVIFLVLGIGADDVFVLVDGWRQSETDVPQLPGEDDERWLHRRLAACYSRTMQAVFNTSFTTAMAFVSTAVSPVMPISAFGIYATICIVVNYLFVITLTPPAIIIHHKHFGGFGPAGWCWINKCMGKKGAEVSAANKDDPFKQAVELTAVSDGQGSAGGGGKTVNVLPKSEAADAESSSPSERPPMERQGTFVDHLAIDEDTELLSKVLIRAYEFEAPESWPAPFKGLKVVSLLAVLSCLAVAITMSVYASYLALPTEQEQWFPKDHMVQRFVDRQPEFLLAEDGSYPVLNLVWGARPNIQRKDFDHWEADKHRGTARFDPNFDLANPEAFAAVTEACTLLQDRVCKAKGCDPVGYLVQPDSVVCPVSEFETWHVATYGVSATTLYDASTNSATFYERLLTFRSSTAPSSDPYGTWEDLIGVIDGTFRYLVVTGDMTVEFEEPNAIKKDVLEICQKLLKSIDKPDSARHVMQISVVWVWYATNDALLHGMLQGLAIAFPVAFCTLIFATQNVVIALYAILTIGAIVGSVLGAAQQQGWALGIAESVAAVIVIGFSVDYTIHLGHMYDHAGHEGFNTRSQRARFAILKMGSTVFAGAITTAGSGAFLFPCQLTFFNKMAFLIVFTIVFSLLYSLCLFMPLLYLAGPYDNCGHVSTLVPAFVAEKVAPKKETSVS